MKLFICASALLLVAAAGTGSAAPAAESTVCQNAVCKSIADDLLHKSMNEALNPCDDFYDYVCGNFEKTHPLTAESARLSAFTIRNSEIHQEIEQSMSSEKRSKSHAVSYLANLFSECSNITTHNARGLKPLQSMVDTALGGWPMTKAGGHVPHGKHWNTVFTELFAHTGVSPVFRMVVQYQPRMKQSLLMIGPGGTGLPPQVLLNQAHYAKQVQAYKDYIRQSALLFGATDNAKLKEDIEQMVHLEMNIAHVLQLNPFNFIRLGTLSGLNTATNHRIDWVNWINSILVATKSTTKHLTLEDKIGVANIDYLHGAAEVLDQSKEEVVQNLFAWLTIYVFGPLTTDQFRHNEAVFRSTLTGVKVEVPTPEYCFNVANAKLPFAMGRVYVDTHFTPADKKEAEVLVKEIKGSFQNVLSTNDWLDAETKKLALEKLAAIKENIAYPDWVMADADLDHYYEHLKGVNVQAGKFLESAMLLNTLTTRHSLDTMHDAINHTLLWPMTPATVNAAYMPAENSITIPAAVLKTPFFDKARPFSMNYGSIGAIIGHEMTHGFDNNGRRFDLHGEMKNWWTLKTQTEFNHKAQCMVTQYGSAIEPTTHLHVNGQLTLGENIADNGGVKESWNAYKNHIKNVGAAQTLPGLKYNADQLFFISYARNWCSVSRPEVMASLIRTNPHPPERFRVNIVLANSKAFSEVFKCPAGSKMNPADKCAVW